jgi:Transposase IS116/IS110/IS902 family
VLQAIARFDLEIAPLASTLPDYTLCCALPGAGAVYAPRRLAAFGDQRERYQRAADIQTFAGLAPLTERSGHQCWVHWR